MNTKQSKLRSMLRVLGWGALCIVTFGLAIVVVRKIWAPRFLDSMLESFLFDAWMTIMAIVVLVGFGVDYLFNGSSADRPIMQPDELPGTYWHCTEEALDLDLTIGNDTDITLTHTAEDGTHVYSLAYEYMLYYVFAQNDEPGAEDGELLMEGEIYFYEDYVWMTVRSETNRLIDSSYKELYFCRVTE